MTTVADLSDWMEAFAPTRLAEDWDNVGLLLGDPGATIDKVMTCLTVTPRSASEAIEEGAGLIVSHHPIWFKPVQSLAQIRVTDSSGPWQGPESRFIARIRRSTTPKGASTTSSARHLAWLMSGRSSPAHRGKRARSSSSRRSRIGNVFSPQRSARGRGELETTSSARFPSRARGRSLGWRGRTRPLVSPVVGKRLRNFGSNLSAQRGS